MSRQRAEPELIERIAALLAAGRSGAEIGCEIGRSRNAVIGLVHRTPALLAIGFRRPPPSMYWTVRKRAKIEHPVTRIRAKAAAKERPAPPPEPIVVAPVSRPTIAEIRDHQCRWPLWGDAVGITDKRYCGMKKVRGSYCAKHAAKSYANGRIP